MLAVNVTDVPEQIVLPGLAAMEIVGVTTGFTVMVMELDVTVAGLTQEALLVITQVTTLLLASVVDVKVVELVPVFTPLTFH